MKVSKLLLSIASVATATSIPFITSCSKPEWTIEEIEDSIFKPVVERQEPTTGNFVDELKSVGKKDQQREIFYGLYAPIVNKNSSFIKNLYEDGYLSVMVNVNKCEMAFDNTEIAIYFIGYVNFVFIKEYTGIYNVNDFIQVTFLMDGWKVSPENTWSLNFPSLIDPPSPTKQYGFIEEVRSGQRFPLVPIFELPSQNPTNWHHWGKQGS